MQLMRLHVALSDVVLVHSDWRLGTRVVLGGLQSSFWAFVVEGQAWVHGISHPFEARSSYRASYIAAVC